jgi:hypothetical protein
MLIWWARYNTVIILNYIFTIIDRTSKWMEAIPLSDKSAAACAKALTLLGFPVLAFPK